MAKAIDVPSPHFLTLSQLFRMAMKGEGLPLQQEQRHGRA